MLLPLLSLLALAAAGAAGAPTAAKVVLNDPLATCLDGSPAALYISRGTSPTPKFYIYHQGGGWCQTADECAERAKDPLGSSASYGSTRDLGSGATHVFFSRDKAVNPLMSDWTFVFLPYCDGGSFTGDNTTTVTAAGGATTALHFRGLRIREAVVRYLTASAAFAQATDLVVGGCSAGGAAAYLHVDWYASQAPEAAKVRGMPDSGWFLNGNYARDFKKDYGSSMRHMFQMINASAGLDPTCVAQQGYKCLFAPTAIHYIKTPVFALNSKYDASMNTGSYNRDDGSTADYTCTSYVGLPCDAASVNAFGQYVTADMKKSLAPPHGAYLDSCFRHCSINCANYNIGIGNATATSAAALWYAEGSAAMPNNGFYDQDQPFRCAGCCD